MPTNPNALAVYLNKPEALSRFMEIFPNEQLAKSYIQSVLILAADDPKLQDCTPRSIFVSALRAASLGLSCDKSLKQAYLIPYWSNKKKCYEAQFQPHYLGLYNLAMRTRKYQVIDVTPFPEGYELRKDLATHNEIIVGPEGLPVVYAPRVKPQDAGAWYGYLRAKDGSVKKIWMTKQEIHEHAQKFNPKGYNADGSLWKSPEHCHTMEAKTVLRELLNWADKSGLGDQTLREVLSVDNQELIEAQAEDLPTPDIQETPTEETQDSSPAPIIEKRPREETLSQLGFN
jgi:phage RecT family recombinase